MTEVGHIRLIHLCSILHVDIFPQPTPYTLFEATLDHKNYSLLTGDGHARVRVEVCAPNLGSGISADAGRACFSLLPSRASLNIETQPEHSQAFLKHCGEERQR